MIGNLEEALELAKVKGYGTTDLGEIVKKMCMEEKKNTERPRIVVITQAHLDTTAASYDFVKKEYKSQVISPTAIESKDIADTNGAGDSFAGGLLAGLVLGKDLNAALKFANYLAWECIKQVGCVFPEKCAMTLD